ncbi:MAG TPA: methyltransferase domain-containing protein [Egicoccus sp.]|nr:methyltransferase domain-containing protein [Egicoccus sp.]HSK22902.1 methyltransferase domain-containing protein [Egicoccus sp.]
MRRRTGLRLDPFLSSYVATIRAVLEPLGDRDVLDVSAGSGWVRQFDFSGYTPVDIFDPNEYWDLDTPLPEAHAGSYDLVVNLGSLHYTRDPVRSLEQMVLALRPGGDMVVMVPWMFPPHDRRSDRWRIAPIQLWEMLDRSFDTVDLFLVGNVFQLPVHAAKRLLAGPFVGVTPAELAATPRRRAAPRLAVADAGDVPARWTGPVNVVAHARSCVGGGP